MNGHLNYTIIQINEFDEVKAGLLLEVWKKHLNYINLF